MHAAESGGEATNTQVFMIDEHLKKEIDKDLDESLYTSLRGDFEKAEALLRKHESSALPPVIFNLGYYEIKKRNLSKALRYMDAGRWINCFGNPPVKDAKIWRDEPLEGKTILFRCEGGLGDQVINFRFARYFKEKGALVVIECEKSLKEMFSRHGFVTIEIFGTKFLHFDYWVPSMSVAHMLGIEMETLPSQRYLFCKKRAQLYSKSNNLKVGLRWAGNPEFEHEQYRKFPAELMLDLASEKDVNFYSLQRDEDCIDGLPFADLRPSMTTVEDTMNVIEDLDLVITSCTFIAHLAAAMGKEVWVVVPVLSYYIWACDKDKSSWYENVRIFRQKTFGEWDEPFAEIKKALKEKVCTHK